MSYNYIENAFLIDAIDRYYIGLFTLHVWKENVPKGFRGRDMPADESALLRGA